MITKKLFLASSSELKDDRRDFEIFISRKNKDWVARGVFLELVVWEDFLDAVSQTRLQDEYNRQIRQCDLFVMLFWTKVGQYTEEEFKTAFGQFKTTNKPFIFTYFKDAEITTGSANRQDLMSLWAFQDSLSSLGHFYTRYNNIDQLKFQFNQQLDKLAANGFINFDLRVERNRVEFSFREYQLQELEEKDRKLLARISVFHGGFSFIACAAVNSDFRTRDLKLRLDRLLEKGIVRGQEADAQRYDLSADLRPAAADLLESFGASRTARRDHAQFFRDFVEVHERRLMGPQRRGSLRDIELDLPNITAAIEWCLQQQDMREDALRTAGALFWFWNMSARFKDGGACLRKVLEGTGVDAQSTTAGAKALYAQGGLAFLEGRGGVAVASLEESVRIWKTFPASDDRNRWLAYALVILGRAKQFEEGRELEKEAVRLLDELNDVWGQALALNDLGFVLASQNELGKAEEIYESSLSHWTKLNDPWGLPLALNNLGWLKAQQNKLSEARAAHDLALRYHIGEGDRWGAAESLKYLAELACKSDNFEEADQCYRESLSMHREIGRKRLIYDCLVGLATLATTRLPLSEERAVHATRLLGAAERHAGDSGFVFAEGQKMLIQELNRKLESYLGRWRYKQSRDDGGNMTTDDFVKVSLW
jgi:tetratricopeptide (TPR) repeat protein